MSKRLSIEPEAERDLLEAYDWYEQQRPGLGEDFLLCVEAALEAIENRPKSFPRVWRRARRALLHRFPYSVLFMELTDVVAVLGIFHTSRDPKRWRRRV